MTMTKAEARPGRRERRLRRRDLRAGLLFLAPLAAGLLVFKAFGFGYNIYLSFTRAGAFGRPQWIGMRNYQELFSDPQFGRALVNTLRFVVLGVPPIVVVSLAAALLLQKRVRGIGFFRSVLFLPAVTLHVAVYLIFAWMFNTQFGIVNSVLDLLGIGGVNWFGSRAGVTAVLVMVMTYTSFSTPMLVMLAGLNDIPESYFEAARIDGATRWQQFWLIKLPLLTPAIFYVGTTNIISMFQMFTPVFVMLPAESTGLQYGETIVYYYYTNAFVYTGARGYASAISVVLFALILMVTLVAFRMQKRWVHYEN